METASKKIIWLASWYPSRLKPFDGDFIQRHAQAASLYNDIYVIHAVRDEQGTITRNILIEQKQEGRLTEVVIYYYIKKQLIPAIDKLRSARVYKQVLKQAIEKYITDDQSPSLIHVHTGMKAGVIALWARQNYGIPYIVTEHWTGFLEEATSSFRQLPWYYRRLWKKVLKSSNGISIVSHYLKGAVEKIAQGMSIRVIPNVVNTALFTIATTKNTNPPRFTHISNLQLYKNPEQILLAFRQLVQTYPSAKLDIIGGENRKLMQQAIQYGLKGSVGFYPEIPQKDLAEFIHNSMALILYSHYETFGCVIIEANACGVPVIVSDIPVFHETVQAGMNGIFAKAGSPDHLAAAMAEMIKKQPQFDAVAIAALTAEKYGYATVGKQFNVWYNESLKS
jgi:glycosyltransferase involved in cell wall biosynthesis